MAKKAKKVEVEEPQIQEEVQVVEKPQPVKVKKEEKKLSTKLEKGWEVKDRYYYLKKDLSPLSFMLKSSGVYYFDEEKGYERELKCTVNQKTPFVDEFPKGSDARLEHIIFRNGTLAVPKNKQTLQKLLSLYHPQLNVKYAERQADIDAANHVDWIEMEITALNTAYELDLDMAEAVMRVEVGSEVSKMSSKELKRDVLVYAKNNPQRFLEIVNDDNIYLRNIGIKATESGVITLSSDNRTFTWTSSGRKLLNVPYEEHPYSALAAWFKTDEGMEVFNSIEKGLK